MVAVWSSLDASRHLADRDARTPDLNRSLEKPGAIRVSGSRRESSHTREEKSLMIRWLSLFSHLRDLPRKIFEWKQSVWQWTVFSRHPAPPFAVQHPINLGKPHEARCIAGMVEIKLKIRSALQLHLRPRRPLSTTFHCLFWKHPDSSIVDLPP